MEATSISTIVITIAVIILILIVKKHITKSLDGIGEVGQIKIAQYKSEILMELGDSYNEEKVTKGLEAFDIMDKMKIEKKWGRSLGSYQSFFFFSHSHSHFSHRRETERASTMASVFEHRESLLYRAFGVFEAYSFCVW